MKLKRIVIIEVDQIKITTSFNRKQIIFCEICQMDSRFITRSEAMEMAKMMYAQELKINYENIHYFQNAENETLLCLNSIINGS